MSVAELDDVGTGSDPDSLPKTRGKQQVKRLRCAIYTRKSTEDGLDQDFNSLDAQREACAAYVTSQASLGWKLSATHYDDGGISGGTMERPALQQLLDDIKQGLIDIIVVYKIDRLTRSLMDFAKMVDLFDDKGISFVSVTQQFNTTTSMGRLTLNVLLSFAQFEREVTAERIRDKITASKKKGMWMGGTVPLGYKAEDKKLIVDPDEAKTVRWLFEHYLKVSSVNQLAIDANASPLITKTDKRSKDPEKKTMPFGRGNLYHLLSNPIYIGKVRHQGNIYDGQHEAIIDESLWAAVQDRMANNTKQRRSKTNSKSVHLFTGKIIDETGARLSTSHTIKNGKRYNYYISINKLSDAEPHQSDTWRIPARELEQPILRIIDNYLTDPLKQSDSLNLRNLPIHKQKNIFQANAKLAKAIATSPTPRRNELLSQLIKRVEITPKKMVVELNASGLMNQEEYADVHRDAMQELIVTIEVAHHMQRRGVEAKLVLTDNTIDHPRPDQTLIKMIANAHFWLNQLTDGTANSIGELSKQQEIDATEISRFLPLAFLAPDIVQDILAGTQPVDLTTDRLRRMTSIPTCWNEQRQLLGFAA